MLCRGALIMYCIILVFPDCPEFCTSLYAPVCGSNGVTYSNECMMKEATCLEETEVTVAFEGRCADGPPGK